VYAGGEFRPDNVTGIIIPCPSRISSRASG